MRLCAKTPEQSGFCVEGGIGAGINLVLVAEDNFAVLDQHCSKGFVSMADSQLGQAYGFFHKDFIIHHVVPPGFIHFSDDFYVLQFFFGMYMGL